MRPILVLFATREGQTRLIAGRVAAAVEAHGLCADVVDVARMPAGFALAHYSAAILCASVHLARRENDLIDFVKNNRVQLESMPSAFISVSLSEGGVDELKATPQHREQCKAEVNRAIQRFLDVTGWHPGTIQAVAGALVYTKYNFLLRFIMKRIGAAASDHDYADWVTPERMVDQVVAAIPVEAAMQPW